MREPYKDSDVPQSSADLLHLVKAAGFVAFSTDGDGRFITVADNVTGLIGYTPNEMIGEHYSRFVHPDWRAQVVAFYQQQAQERIAQTRLEYPILTRGGQEKWIEQTTLLIEDDTGPRVQALARDITPHVQSESSYRQISAIVEHGGNFVAMADAEGRITYLNETAQQMVGIGWPSQHEPPRMMDFVAPDDRELFEETILPAVRQHGHWEGELAYRHVESGALLPVQAHIFNMRAVDSDLPIAYATISRSLSEQKQAQQALAQSERLRYKALFDQTHDAVFIIGLDQQHKAVNRQAAEMLGYSVEELAAIGISDVVVPGEYAESMQVLERLLAGERVPIYERTFRKKSGETFPVEINVTLVRDQDGNPLHIQSVVRDITGRKQQAAALEASERRNRALLEALPDLMLVINREGRFIEAKATILEDLLRPPEELIGRRLTDFDLPVRMREQTMAAIQQALATGKIQVFDYELTTPNGPSVFDARAVALNEDEVLFVVRNITELKRTEEALARRLEQLTTLRKIDAELAYNLDADYVLTMALDSAMRLSGADVGFIGLFQDEDRLVISKAVGAYSQEVLQATIDQKVGILAEVIARQEAAMVFDLRSDPGYLLVTPEVQARMAIPLISQERLIGVLNLETRKAENFNEETFEFIKLLTARIAIALDNAFLHRQTELQLVEMQRLYNQVQRLEKLKTDMIRIASHDLRNPLGTILGYVQLLRVDLDSELTEARKEYLDIIQQGVRRMQKIISEILSLERIVETVQHATMELFNISELVRSTFDEHIPQAQLKAQHYTLNIQPGDIFAEGDPLQIHEAMANLISNALKYTPARGQVTVRLSRDRSQVIFEVVDNGPGVPAGQQKRLFEPFFRAKTPETEEIEGSGLGLHLVKNIIERFEGQIIFESAYGKGSTFGFSLPLGKP